MKLTYKNKRLHNLITECMVCGETLIQLNVPYRGVYGDLENSVEQYKDETYIHACDDSTVGLCKVVGGRYIYEKMV